MKTMLSSIDLIIECRDYRLPLTSRNPLFEENLAGRARLIVYTKQDLGSEGRQRDRRVCSLPSIFWSVKCVLTCDQREDIIQQWHHPVEVLFSDHKDPRSVRKVLNFARNHADSADSLTGSRMMIVGMPNVGKSSLLNALRKVGMNKGKAAQTGAQPGITRKIGTTVKIVEATEAREGVYLVDTPGVFIPYVPNSESMLKLALCGSVKDTIIAPATLADYLLYQLNLKNPTLYEEYSRPTNDIIVLLDAVARKTGRLQKGGTPDQEASALWLIQRWRGGHLGRFVLDETTGESLDRDRWDVENMSGSASQARRSEKEVRRQKSKAKHLEAG